MKNSTARELRLENEELGSRLNAAIRELRQLREARGAYGRSERYIRVLRTCLGTFAPTPAPPAECGAGMYETPVQVCGAEGPECYTCEAAADHDGPHVVYAGDAEPWIVWSRERKAPGPAWGIVTIEEPSDV